MKFLVDECLSVTLLALAHQAGHGAHHVAHVGKSGWQDWKVARQATDGDFILVTNNAMDFRNLYAAQPLHAGLLIIIPNINRAGQHRLFEEALAEITALGDLTNRVLEVDLKGGAMTFTLYNLPAAPR